jgi:hypothetical protein
VGRALKEVDRRYAEVSIAFEAVSPSQSDVGQRKRGSTNSASSSAKHRPGRCFDMSSVRIIRTTVATAPWASRRTTEGMSPFECACITLATPLQLLVDGIGIEIKFSYSISSEHGGCLLMNLRAMPERSIPKRSIGMSNGTVSPFSRNVSEAAIFDHPR